MCIRDRLEHVPPLLSLLTRSATGQNISTYFNMISSPRKPYEKDGPGEVHLVLLDLSLIHIFAACIASCWRISNEPAAGTLRNSPRFRRMLSCIRRSRVAERWPTNTLCEASPMV